MNSALMFSKATDEWSTPDNAFAALHDEFNFVADMAASAENRKCDVWFGPGSPYGEDALAMRYWPLGQALFINPPYSKCAEFVARAAKEAAEGAIVVMLIPSRTDTRYWHAHIWDAEKNRPRPGVEVRFIKGRLKFGGSKNSAPFPSAVVIFRPA
jgi:phage N-6-adenine-methyltransferase